jgi:hypothetical protein
VSHDLPACWPLAQSASVVQRPQAPVAVHSGFAAVGHASVAFEPLSPLHAAHALAVASQTGVVPLHVEESAHASQSPAFAPVVAQIFDRHTVAPFEAVHGPSPFFRPQSPSWVSQTPDTQARPPSVVVHEPPGTGCPLSIFGEHTAGIVRSSHHRFDAQSLSVVQVVPQTPVAVLQIGPACVPVVQSALLAHLPHVPAGAQNGAAESVHASLAVEPSSPLQATQLFEVASHTGVVPVQIVASPGTHVTHAFDVVSHAGVGLAQVVSSMQATQRPAFAPVVAHSVERQTVAPLVASHGPSPFAKPHLSSFVSQAPLRQTSAPALVVHLPFSVGLACAASVGIAAPFASFGAHACVDTLHHVPVAQSPSTLQPPGAMQVPPVEHTPERQTSVAFDGVHEPPPFA